MEARCLIVVLSFCYASVHFTLAGARWTTLRLTVTTRIKMASWHDLNNSIDIIDSTSVYSSHGISSIMATAGRPAPTAPTREAREIMS